MKKKRIICMSVILALMSCEMILAWRVPGFSDFYVKYIFSFIENSFGRLSGLLPFSIGEFLIYGAVGYVLLTVLLWLVRLVKLLEKKKTFKKLSRGNTRVFFWIVLIVLFIQVQNCFILYHTTPLYEGTGVAAYEPNKEDLIRLREMLVNRANMLCETFDRNEKGEIIIDKDLKDIAVLAMKKLGDEAKARVKEGVPGPIDEKLSLLTGYYSRPKYFYKSDFFCQQSICGYYFPFSLEANVNELMYVTNKPDTMCHELSHLKGFIFEDEASFISYLACLSSEDPFFIYSGTIEALGYVNGALYKEMKRDPSIGESLTKTNPLVIYDSMFITEEVRAKVEEDAWFKTETVEEITDVFLDTNLTLNGVSDGIISYSRVVNLLLKYYYMEGYAD